MTAPPDDTTTDTSAIIAALRAERDAALSEKAALAEALATRNSEYGERIEQQSATIDVLKVMSASPGDPQPVFDLIVDRARDLCDAYGATVFEFDGTGIHWRAATGVSDDPAVRAAYEAQFPMVPTRGWAFGRAILDRRIIRIDDMEAEPGLDPTLRGITAKSNVTIPIMRGDEVIGAIGMGSREKGGFSDSQVDLLKTFAEQAAIAITSAETYRALQTRTSDLQETLEYQTATSDVLKVISRSTFDLQPVLDTLVETAARLCDADQAIINRREGAGLRLAANFGFPPEYEAHFRSHGLVSVDAHTVSARAASERRPVHIHDVTTVPGYPEAPIRLGKQRTSLGVPLLREEEVIGTIVLARRRVEPFTERQIELVSTFADQAVIAIENTRLLTETRDALEQQTATTEVLEVINSSPGDLVPVFDAMLENAMRLCGAAYGVLRSFDGERMRVLASRGVPAEYAAFLAQNVDPVMPGTVPTPGTGLMRALQTGRPAQTLDARESVGYSGSAGGRAIADLGGARTILHVPLVKDQASVGLFTVYRQEVRDFSDKQIALLENFAAQAVIAMENARLLTEQREALEQQTATAEVLQVINASPGDLVPVFDAVLEKAMRLCGGTIGGIFTFDGDHSVTSAVRGVTAAFQEYNDKYPMDKIQPGTLPARIIETRGPVQNPDLTAGENYRAGHPYARALVELGGIRAVLAVPLLKDGVAVGMVAIYRQEAGAFSDKQIALLQNFAAQAVIAMENARLLTEQQEALEQQTATAEVLQVINASPGDLAPVFDAMLEKAMRLCDAGFGSLYTYDGDRFQSAAQRGVSAAYAAYRERHPPELVGGAVEEAIRTRRAVQVTDMMAERIYLDGRPNARAMVDLGGMRSGVVVPLCKDETALGVISIFRQEVRPFSDKQIALLENFAAQAVIAMENARLLTEQREALEQQTATAEVLQVINASPGHLAPVFDAMLDKATRLCDAAFGILWRFDGKLAWPEALHQVPAGFAEFWREPRQPSPVSGPGRMMRGENAQAFPDIAELPVYAAGDPMTRAIVDLAGARSSMIAPLRKDGATLGAITIYRQEVRPFSDQQIALLQNFAAQAVVAMENARLINEQREALEQQTATAEVLQVINTSPGDLAPVFDAMLDKAIRLCDATYGHFRTYDGEGFALAAVCGDPSLVELHRQRMSYFVPGPHNPISRFPRGERLIHISDAAASEAYRGDPGWRELVNTGALGSVLAVALRKDTALLGYISVYRQEVRVFSDKQIALLENFAAQAVIAMENARLLDEIRRRQAELRTTFDNMGDGVAMFDADLRLAAWNRNFQQIIDLPDVLLRERPRYADYMRLLAERGEFGATGIEAELRHFIEDTDKELRLERVRPDGRAIEVRRNAVPGGGFVLIYSDITERKRSEEEIRAARDDAETALCELRTAQANLIQAEKMASLGQLTAGIAHEIKNPLNFVNNFSALSTELVDELRDVLTPEPLGETARTEVDDLTALLKGNLEKVVQHGQRADSIVRSMLDHSRGSSGERRMVDLNVLIDEALNLAYHGARAQDQSFNITLERDFGEGIAPIEVNPQDMTRVFLNLFSNGFYAATRRAREGGDAAFVPTLKVATRDAGEAVAIRVRDNGTGIPADIRDKLFQPFFTTKPTGEGTGLGLSITYDIVTQQHGGGIVVDSNVDEYSEFIIRLPRNP